MKKLVLSTIFLIVLLFGLVPTGDAIGYYFGRNKVQYSDFEWKVMETPHFKIYFYEEEKELAEIAAKLCEESYADLTIRFKDHPYRKVPLIVYSSHLDFQQTNVTYGLVPESTGGLTEFLKGRVLIPHTGSYADLKHVIQHELVHVFMLAKLSHNLKQHDRMEFNLPPLWFVEGLAEYWSTEWDPDGENILRDYTLAGHILDLREMWRMQGTYTMYKVGQLLCEFIAETYGDEKILMIMDNWWKADTFEAILLITLGESYEKVSRKWVYWVKKRYFPIIEEGEAVPFAAEEITTEGYADMKPAVVPSPLGGPDTLVFLSNRTGYSNIYQINTAQKETRLSAIVKGERSAQFESFHQYRSRIDVNSRREIVFVSKSEDKDHLYIWSIPRNKLVKKLSFEKVIALSSPYWSPDNRRIVFNGLSRSGYSDLYVVVVDSEELTQLTNDFYDDQSPAWSPLGDVIVFSSDRNSHGHAGAYNLFEYSLDTRAIYQLTFGEYRDISPAWSHSGTQLAFASDRTGVYNLYVMPVEKNKTIRQEELTASLEISVKPIEELAYYPPRPVTNYLASAIDPVWSNDEKNLIFTGFNEHRYRLFQSEVKLEPPAGQPIEKVKFSRAEWQPVSIQDTDYQLAYDEYKPRFSLDIAQGGVGYLPDDNTTEGGVAFALSDMLGDHFILMTLSNTAQTRTDLLKNFNVSATYLNRSNRWNWGFGGFHFVDDYYDGDGSIYHERSAGVVGIASYPFSKFKRIDFSSVAEYSDRSGNYPGYYSGGMFDPDRKRKGYFITNYISYVKDTSLWGPAGPLDGVRYNATIGGSYNLSTNEPAYFVLMGDYRHYFRLSRQSAYAFRIIGRYSDGDEREIYRMGGSWSLRGYKRNSLIGNYLVLVNNELRFPLLNNAILQFPFGNMEFFMVRGAIFFDAGNTWYDETSWDLKGSFGLGLRLNLFGVLVLRWDFARRTDFKDISKKTYREFFFGWNY